VSSASSGEFVVVWSDIGTSYPGFNGQDGSDSGVFGRRFSATGAPLGPEFQVNTYTTSTQGDAVVGSDATGGFVVVWTSGYPAQQDGDWGGVFGQRFSDDGLQFGDEFQDNSHTTGDQSSPDMVVAPTGEFVVVWDSEYQDGSYRSIFGQRFATNGSPEGDEFQVNTQTTDFQMEASVSMDADRNFVVTWTDWSGQDGSGSGIFAQRFASDGDPIGAEFQVNSYTTHDQSGSEVTVGPAGDFIITWGGPGGSPGGHNMYGQLYDLAGIPVGDQFRINAGTDVASYGGFGRIAGLKTGEFVAAWEGDDKKSGGISSRAFSENAMPLTDDFQVNTYTTGFQGVPSLSAGADGTIVIVWESPHDGDVKGVFGRRLSLAQFVDGFESGDTSAWSITIP